MYIAAICLHAHTPFFTGMRADFSTTFSFIFPSAGTNVTHIILVKHLLWSPSEQVDVLLWCEPTDNTCTPYSSSVMLLCMAHELHVDVSLSAAVNDIQESLQEGLQEGLQGCVQEIPSMVAPWVGQALLHVELSTPERWPRGVRSFRGASSSLTQRTPQVSAPIPHVSAVLQSIVATVWRHTEPHRCLACKLKAASLYCDFQQ